MSRSQRLNLGKRLSSTIREGDDVVAFMDDDTAIVTIAMSDPWELGGGAWVVKLRDMTGGFDLTRCRRLRKAIR